MINIFNHDLVRKVVHAIRFLIFFVFLSLIVIYAQKSVFYAALCISFLGESIQIWAAASLKKNKSLSFKGPYALVRNPMYLGRFFVLLGFIVLQKHTIWIIVYCILYSFYFITRVSHEEKRLKKKYGGKYADYANRIHRFIPRFSNLSFSDLAYFNVSNLLTNLELYNLVGIISFYIIVYIKINY